MKSGFFARLAADNIKKNGRIYLPYMLTCIVTVMMFYMIKSLSLNPGLKGMVGGNFMNNTMGMGSWVVAIFSFIFLFYTNSFLMKQRKKEFGVFHILGMEKRHLSRVAGWENFYVMTVSLLLGTVLGIALDKVMFLAVIRLIGAEVSLGFFISPRALETTVVFFAVTFMLLYLNSVRQIYKADPIELLRAGNMGEKDPKANWLLTILGLASLGSGYYLAVTTTNPIASILTFFVAVLLVIAGTYLLFTAGSIALLKALRKNKGYYYRTNHFISISGMIYRMKQNAVGLANICILSTMVLVMVSSTTAMVAGMDHIVKNRYPADYVFYCEKGEKSIEEHKAEIKRLLKEQGVSVQREWEYRYLAFQAIREEEGYSVLRERARSVEDDTDALFFVPLSDYNAVMGESKSLEPGEIMIYSNRRTFREPVLKLFGREYSVAEKLEGFVGNGRYEALICATLYIVVPDMDTILEIYEAQKQVLTDLAGNIGWVYGFDTDAGEEEQVLLANACMERPGLTEGCYLETMLEGKAAFLEINGGLFFIGIFLGILFVMATVLIIYYKQISEGYEDKNRFEIMQKVGLSRSEVKASIHSQVLTVFFLPLAAAGLHVAAASPLIVRLLAILNLYQWELYLVCVVSCFVIFGIMYVLVYALTARTYYRIVSR